MSIFEYNAEEEIRKYKIAQREFWREQWEAEERAKEHAEGKKSAYISLIVSYANELGEMPDCLSEKLKSKDEDTLESLVKLAAKVTSVEEIMKALE